MYMRITILIFLIFFMAFPVSAQNFEEEFDPDAPIIGEGRRGRITLEQGKPIALHAVPGEILSTDVERENSRLYYEYTIETPDGSVFEVELNAQNGEIYEIEVENLSAEPVLPTQIIAPETLENIALAHIQKKTNSRLKTKLQSSQLTAFERKLAYRFEFKQSARFYEVWVDAVSGRVLRDRKKK